MVGGGAGHVLLRHQPEAQAVQALPGFQQLLAAVHPHALDAQHVAELLRIDRLDEDAIEPLERHRRDVRRAVDEVGRRVRHAGFGEQRGEARLVLQQFLRLPRAGAGAEALAQLALRQVGQPQRGIVGAGDQHRLVQRQVAQVLQCLRTGHAVPCDRPGRGPEPARTRHLVARAASYVGGYAGQFQATQDAQRGGTAAHHDRRHLPLVPLAHGCFPDHCVRSFDAARVGPC